MADMLGWTCLTVNLLKMTAAASVRAEVTGQLADMPTRGLDISRTGQLADWSPRGLVNSQTGQVADWTTRGLADAAKRTKTKHAKSPVASTSCPVRKLAIRELAYPQVVQ